MTWRVVTKPLGGTLRMLTGTGLVLQNNGGDDITIPAGSTNFTFPGTLANGKIYSVSVLTQPTYPPQSCTVTNGTGTVGAAVSNVSAVCSAVSGFAYVANYGANTVSAYSINASTGALTTVAGSPFAAGGQPISIAVDPTG
ncbi:MAG: hypothetical protein V1736_06015 [Pseudomonadota bacterium]